MWMKWAENQPFIDAPRCNVELPNDDCSSLIGLYTAGFKKNERELIGFWLLFFYNFKNPRQGNILIIIKFSPSKIDLLILYEMGCT